MSDITPKNFLAELEDVPRTPFLLAGGNPSWTPRVPELALEVVRVPNSVGRPKASDLTGIAVTLPNGLTCVASSKLSKGRWECITDAGIAVFTGKFLRALQQSQGR